MSSSTFVILAVLFIYVALVSSRIHQTADSIVIEVEPKVGDRKGRYMDSAGKFLPVLYPVSHHTLLKNVFKYQSFGVPANTFLMTAERSNECWMPDGKYGLCGPVRSCFPHDKLQEPLYPESRMFPSRNLCHYVNNHGKEATGVCCPRASFALNGMIPWPYLPFLPQISMYNVPQASSSATWPWWVPDKSPATESPPSKTSPWWVPDAISTTASPSSTSSPWWVPDSSTTTSPWWVPETSSTTALPPSSSALVTVSSSTTTTTTRPSTTSPWWIPEVSSTTASPPSSSALVTVSSSTTTTRPSTTSPWWIPEVSSTTASPPSTTSPWWVAETLSTTKAPPSSTTSPWWVPEASSTLKMDIISSTTTSTMRAPTTSSSNGFGFKCGTGPYKVFHTDDTQRIVGGVTSVKNAWPFAVSLVARDRHFCGGSLLDDQHILTAAHCVASLSSNEIAGVEVLLGLHTLKPMDAQVVRRKLRRVVRHKGYHAANFFNDIAILKLDSPVKFSNTISPVCLPSSGTKDLYVNKEAVVVGWGALQEDGKLLPISLQQVTVKVQTNAECQRSYQIDAPGGINDNMLCAASPQKDSCMGDSGGPLVMQPTPGSPWIQVGIVSWGIGCAREEFPGVYVRTTSFIDWIKKVLN